MINNGKNKKQFTVLLEDLICHKSCDLQNALLLMSKSEKRGKRMFLWRHKIFITLLIKEICFRLL